MNEGGITVELELREGRVAEVSIASTRPALATRALEGMSLEDGLRRVRALFALCGAAHFAAAEAAFEAALGLEAEPARVLQREVLCALEAIDSLALQICAVWPRALGRAPDAARLLELRASTEALRGRLGAGAVGCERLRSAVAAMVPEAALSGDDRQLLDWAARGAGPAAAWLREVFEAGAAEFGAAQVPLLPQLDARWFAPQLADDSFCARPTFSGSAAESGAVAMAVNHPAVQQQLRIRGRSLITRAVAELAELQLRVEFVERACTERWTPRSPRAWSADASGSGSGAGVADTARGRLAHAVTIVGGRVERWRTVAPTEWNFHPRGAVREALLGARLRDLRRRAGWLLTALDPCVPWVLELREVDHA